MTDTDAPLPSVVSFKVDITGLSVSDGTTTYAVLAGTQTVDFARLTGLRTLLDINTIPTGTFEFNSNGLAGVLFGGPGTVQVTPFTKYLGAVSRALTT